jgi:hypothetical protein
MSDIVSILPLTIVMVAGPQIISAVFLATTEQWRRNSLAYIAGALVSITLFVSAFYLLTKVLKSATGGSNGGGFGTTVDWVILAVLLFLAVKVYLDRGKAQTPKWMTRLQTADAKFSFKLGFALLGFFPTDIATTFAVGAYLERQGDPLTYAIPFILITLLWLAIPSLAVLTLGHRAETYLPKVRDWMDSHSWVVTEIVIAIFAVIEINSLISA